MPEIFANNPNASAELNKYFPESFSFIESLNNLIEYVKSLPIEPTAEILNKIETLENDFLAVKKASEDATADVNELTEKYISLLQQITTLAVNVSGFTDKTESIEAELQGIQGNITAIKNKNAEQDNSIATINQEISHNDEDILNIQSDIVNIKNIQKIIDSIECKILNNSTTLNITQPASTNMLIMIFTESYSKISLIDIWHYPCNIYGENPFNNINITATNQGSQTLDSEVTVTNNSGRTSIIFIMKFHLSS